MAGNQPSNPSRNLNAVIELLRKLPPKVLIPLVIVGLGVAVVFMLPSCSGTRERAKVGEPGTYLFCSWNVENFFDDTDHDNIKDEMDDFFGKNPEMFQLKVKKLADALMKMNDGIGPDIMALCEVESERCLNALKDELNARLNKMGKADLKFEHVLFKGDNTGRHFAPGIITRLPVDGNRTHKPGTRYNGRIIEGHLEVNGHQLIVIAGHWTSRIARKGEPGDNGEDRRMSYAEDTYGRFRSIFTANKDVDVILCGDFNDEVTDDSMVNGLHVSDSREVVRDAEAEPRLLALFAGWSGDPPGSIYGKGRWSVFDHICFSRGLLDDKGWIGDVASATIHAPTEMRDQVTKKRFEPFKFGDEKVKGERGYSDHFPVTVRLTVK